MKEKPIIFSSEMIRAILEDRKTQTRRIIKLQHSYDIPNIMDKCPYQIGQRLWIKETFQIHRWPSIASMSSKTINDVVVYYKATLNDTWTNWKPSIFMPRWASRINLEVTNIQIERLQDISIEDCIAEGVEFHLLKGCHTNRELFKDLWDSINAKRGYSWDTNPWVWIIEFKRI